MIAAAALGPLLLAQTGAAPLARVSTIPLAAGERLSGVLRADVDGDGRRDLLAVRTTEPVDGEVPRPRLVCWLSREGTTPIGGVPAWEHPLTADVSAFAVADLLPDAGAEVALFSARGVFALRPAAEERDRFVLLAPVDFLWQVSGGAPFPWQRAVVDADGDGLDDLLVPEPDGYRVLRQVRDAEGARLVEFGAPRVPSDRALLGDEAWEGDLESATRSDLEGVGFALDLDGDGERRGPLFSVGDTVPAPRFADLDGDRRPDLLAMTDSFLHAWLQGDEGFPSGPSASAPAPVRIDVRRALDVSYSVLGGDVDGDGRLDLVVLGRDQRADSVRTQVLVYRAADAGAGAALPVGAEPRPSQVLVVDGFVGAPRLQDLDGDGLPELAFNAFRPDLLDTVRDAAAERFDLELTVYRNEGGRLSKRPVLRATLTFSLSEESDPVVAFVGDVTGDGVSELCLRRDARKLELRWIRPSGDTWRLQERPLWELGLDPESFVRVQGVGARRELFVAADRQLQVVEFGR